MGHVNGHDNGDWWIEPLRAGSTIPREIHANGVPWLYWIADGSWQCGGCGERGEQVAYTNVVAFARWVGDLKRRHAACGSAVEVRPDAVGDPLNAHRVEP